MISELREKLEIDFSPLPMHPFSSTPRETQKAAKKLVLSSVACRSLVKLLLRACGARLAAETSDHFVVFDTIRSSICFQKPVADGWTKVREEGWRRGVSNDFFSHRPSKLYLRLKTTPLLTCLSSSFSIQFLQEGNILRHCSQPRLNQVVSLRSSWQRFSEFMLE